MLKAKVAKMGLDVTHFTGKGWRKFRNRFNDETIAQQLIQKSESWKDVFCKGSKVNNHVLMQKMIFFKVKSYVCEICNISNWAGKPLRLQIDHIDGDNTNNEIENLRIVCPNCHSQTHTFCRGNKKSVNHARIAWWQQLSVENMGELSTEIATTKALQVKKRLAKKEELTICGCGNKKEQKSEYCLICKYEKLYKFNPTEKELKQLVWKMPARQVGKLFGVSDKAIEKRCKKLGIEKPSRGYWAKKRLSGKIKPEARKLNISKEELQALVWEMSQAKIAKKLGVSHALISERCKEYSITLPPHGYWRKRENR